MMVAAGEVRWRISSSWHSAITMRVEWFLLDTCVVSVVSGRHWADSWSSARCRQMRMSAAATAAQLVMMPSFRLNRLLVRN